MGKNMPAGKATRFSAEMVAHLMDNVPNPTSENDDDSYVTAASTSTSEIRMDEQLVDTIKKDRAKSNTINEPTTHRARMHRASESNDKRTSICPIVGERGSCERREAIVRLKIHDRKRYNASVILIDNRNESDQGGNFGFLKVGSVIRLHLEETFLLVVNQIVINKEFFEPSFACISIALDHLPTELCRLVLNVDRSQAEIMVEHVPPEELSGKDGSQLDNVQLYFKELYLSRADMWKMRKALIGKTLFQDRDIVSSVLNVNLRISDMWRRGEQVRHGYVSADTRVVFRSSSSMVLIYLQVSEEMFHMDGTGHMLFETCTAGFLSALLQQWEHSKCSHYVSIIMCSRWFFDQSPSAEDIQRGNLVPDQQGRYYQDFYKLLVQNEHYEDWVTPFSKILHIFYDYRDIISAELGRTFPDLPANNYYISVADDGNFLPSLNMSMNMFCMYHSDRRYETTGQQIIYVTAGYGVFNVDEKAVQPTKQKLIDMGISLDMVCLGQQPLHVTPLFIFHDREGQVYKHYIPHWMNYSYFRMDGRKPTLATFTPRVILPQDYIKPTYDHLSMVEADNFVECEESEKEDSEVNSGIDKTRAHMARLLDEARRKVNGESTDTETDREIEQASSRASVGSSLCSLDEADGDGEGFDLSRYGNHRRISDLDLELEVEKNELEEGMSSTDRTTFMQLIERVSPTNNVAQNSSELLEKELNPDPVPAVLSSISQRVPHVHRFSSISGVPQQRERSIGASSLEGTGVTFDLRRGGSSLESGRGRVSSMTRASQAHSYHTITQNQLQPNVYSDFPFKSDSHVVMTANRRRWIHVFPMDVRGMSKLAHHYVQGRSTINIVDIEEPPSSSHRQIPIQGQNDSPLRRAASPQAGGIHQGSPGRVATTSPLESTSQRPPRAWAWAWGSTGEEKWNPDLTIGMDWKSLIRSALLPITTDFFPEGFTIRNQYRVHGYQVFVDHSLIEDIDIPDVKSLTLSELSHLVFDLLISQRLQRGFQIVTLSRRLIKSSVAKAGRFPQDEGYADDDVTLTFSNIYHRLVRRRNDIYVTLLIPDPNRKQFEVAKPGEGRVSRRQTNNTIAPLESQTVSNDRTFENTQYQYYFQVPDAERYEKSTTSFKTHNLDKLNWSLLDTKLTYRSKDELKGYSQLFKDEMKSYSSRFMVVAQSLDPDRAALIVREKLPGETFRERDYSQRAIYGDFTKFLLGLNKLGYVRRETESGDMMVPSLTVANPEQVLNRFLEKCPYIPLQSITQNITLSNNYFLSCDLINWLMENVSQLTTREKATEFVNGEPRINSFRSPPGESDEVDSCRSLDTEKRSIRYGFQLCSLASDSMEIDQQTPLVRYMKVDYVNSCENCSIKDECRFAPGAFDLELSPRGTIDEGHVLGEWCRVVYDRAFSEDKAFEMTIKWFLASGVTVGEAIRGWVEKADKFHFNFFPVPEDAFAMPNDVHSNPLRCPLRIEVAKGVLPVDELTETLVRLLAAFGFVPMYCHRHGTPNQPRSYQVVHECGGMFVSLETPPSSAIDAQPKPVHVFWSWNHMLSHRYRTTALKESMEDFQDYMLREFREVCKNVDGRLLKFYEKSFLNRVGPNGLL